MKRKKLDYIDMHRVLQIDSTDDWTGKLYAFGSISLAAKYYLIWAKNFLDALATEMGAHPELALYFSKKVGVDANQIRAGVDLIESLLYWMYCSF